MQANYVQRVRFRFSKVGPTRYIGHLDLARALERALNRARLPVSYTQGFNPRPRMQIASALPLGYTSECEMADIWLEKRVDPGQAQEQMMSRMAPGLIIHEVWEVPLDLPAMQASTVETAYSVLIDDDLIGRELLVERVRQLLAAEEWLQERRGKEYNLRPLIFDLKVGEAEEGRVLLTMHLSLLPGKTGRPDEVLKALGLDPLDVLVHRTQLKLATEGRTPDRE